ncbi:MAG: M6 family metalloprotease domain-containing protein [Nitrospirae bacterium]|nr:M6 family metalloprotease domain-containing protein [Nitrospirota bacterium]
MFTALTGLRLARLLMAAMSSAVFLSLPAFSVAREYPSHLKKRFEGRPGGKGFGRALHGWRESVIKGGILKSPSRVGRLPTGKFTIRVPVFLMYYAGEKPDWDKFNIESMLFGSWPTGSLRDAYLEYTYGRLMVQGDVVDWFDLTRERAFFEQTPHKDDQNRPCTGLCPDLPGGAAEMVKQTLDRWDAKVDFSQYDNDGSDGIPNSGDDDGFVDTVFFIHGGRGGECGGTDVFSHYFQYSGWFDGRPYNTNDPSARGGDIRIDDYVMQPAMSCSSGKRVEVGVFAHEFGHALGLPDLYDTGTDGTTSGGAGEWELMSSGGYGGDRRSPERPSHLSAWSKMYVGLIEPITLPRCLSGVTLPPIERQPVAYKIPIVDQEYFLIECRLKTGFDEKLPGQGLLIWHADDKVCAERYEDNTVNDDENHPCLRLVEADGRYDLRGAGSRAGSSDPFPGSKEATQWTCATKPGSKGYDDECRGIYITDVGAPDENGCPIAWTELLNPTADSDLGHMTTQPQLNLDFSRAVPISEDPDAAPPLTFNPEASFTLGLSTDGTRLTVSPALAKKTSYDLLSAPDFKDECGGGILPFRLSLDTLAKDDPGWTWGCASVAFGRSTPDLSWVVMMAWILILRGRAGRPRPQ